MTAREEVFVWPSLGPALQERIAAAVPGGVVRFGHGTPSAEARAAAATASVVFGNMPPDWLVDAPALRWLQLSSTGIEAYVERLPELTARDVTVTSARGIFTRPVAETVLAGLLAVHRGLAALVAAQAERRWLSPDVRASSSLLSGSRVLVLGMGSIGEGIADLLAACGCRVTSLDRDHRDEELDSALGECDVVVCAVPHTPSTTGLLSRRRLELLPPGAVVVNVGRGSVLDVDALVDRLRSGALRAAVLDTTEPEPLPEDHPLWSCPGVLLTQHTGGGWSGEWDAKVTLFLDNLQRRCAGVPLRNVVADATGQVVAP